jgi:hypothetical protein
MTEAQAHDFLAKWDKKIFPNRVQSEGEAVKRMRGIIIGIECGMFAVAVTSLNESVCLVASVALLILTIWFHWRLRVACQILRIR